MIIRDGVVGLCVYYCVWQGSCVEQLDARIRCGLGESNFVREAVAHFRPEIIPKHSMYKNVRIIGGRFQNSGYVGSSHLPNREPLEVSHRVSQRRLAKLENVHPGIGLSKSKQISEVYPTTVYDISEPYRPPDFIQRFESSPRGGNPAPRRCKQE